MKTKTILSAALTIAAFSASTAHAFDSIEYGKLTAKTPIKAMVNRQVCTNVPVQVQQPQADGNSPMGTILGGVAGGVIGNRFGGGNGNTAATIAGTIGGAMIGNKMANSNSQPQTQTVMQQQCQNQAVEETVGWNVEYSFGGKHYASQSNRDPGNIGDRVQVGVQFVPLY